MALWFSLACGTAAGAASWPQWRGPNGAGVSAEKNLPTEWSESRNIFWKTPIPGRGHSSPIVWGKRVFLTTAIEGPAVPGAHAPKHMMGGQEFLHPDSMGADHRYALKVLAVDTETGKVLWERAAYEGTPYDNRHRRNSYASPTPITDGQHIYALFAERLFCYDFEGNLIWKTYLGSQGTMGMGVGLSPVLYEELIIVQNDQEFDGKGSVLIAFDRQTGKEVWRTGRTEVATWATPMIVRTKGRAELITSGYKNIVAYDPASGKELWHSEGVNSNAIPSPVAGHGMVFVSAGYPRKTVSAIRLGGSGDVTNTENIVWQYERGTAYVPSPILYGDYLYLIADKGILTCLDARTGKIQYDSGRIPLPATFTASLLAFEDKILLTSEDGDTFVVKAGPVHEVLATNSVGEPVYASPAVADGSIYIRGERNLYSIRKLNR